MVCEVRIEMVVLPSASDFHHKLLFPHVQLILRQSPLPGTEYHIYI